MNIIDHAAIERALNAAPNSDPLRVREICAKARGLEGLTPEEALVLLQVESPVLLDEIFATARWIKNEIYGSRVVLFAPLYISNLCRNDCTYCAFRSANKAIARKALTQAEIRAETEQLIREGHKRLLLVAGEAYPKEGLEYVFNSLDTIYSVHDPKGSIRRVNVNIAPLSTEEFRELKRHQIGTFQLFQETYHEATYASLHRTGPKADYRNRLEAMDRALDAGIEDVGIGALFGLHDWRYEVLALLAHVRHLESRFGVGPHTISIPRIEPANGAAMSYAPPAPVSDADFRKLIAILRMSVPYTGLILSTRESPAMRREALALGISQISAGSRTNPGGYTESTDSADGQFFLGDTRPLAEVIEDIVDQDLIPSFCTGCYRLGRVGKDFMDLAKPGLIKQHCLPNAILTFSEYLRDFGRAPLLVKGDRLIQSLVERDIQPQGLKRAVIARLVQIREGRRDLHF